ncbi:carboxymuconolactone decarboxylase family protein [Variovorax terrae]|uniref:Carboxymuconolactone decarboxylase family protein n=1 Tax=Variovorax terrae TaxID=2923278 RepID=A0A9X1VR97_9BURK|nr:carboxymuconolactone decarboxylase family protein [Variovorax terrae]MCJ0762376.1 carboxymuconolactone decarboxylase family protein [Variovorax terrae]
MEMVDTDTKDPILVDLFGRMKQRLGTVLHVYRLLAWSPALVKAWTPFAGAMRFDLSVSRRLRELLIVQIAAQLGAHYEYEHHLHMALDEGISQAQIDALTQWRGSGLFDADESLVLQLADELAQSPGASAATMKSLQDRFEKKHVIELLVTGALYCAVARIINSLDVELEPDAEELQIRDVRPAS